MTLTINATPTLMLTLGVIHLNIYSKLGVSKLSYIFKVVTLWTEVHGSPDDLVCAAHDWILHLQQKATCLV